MSLPWLDPDADREPPADTGGGSEAPDAWSDPDPAGPSLLLGAYPPDWLGTPEGVDRQLGAWDRAVEQRLSFGGLFVGLEDPNPAHDVPEALGRLVDAGYTPVVNLASGWTMSSLADGAHDDALRAIALAVAAWAGEYPDAVALVAPLPEMNGDWETYGGDPEGFSRFFGRLQRIWAEAGVPDAAIRWVFAPNGWSPEGSEFERFYPGDDRVDLVGFSAYLWGGCGESRWVTPEAVYAEYIARMRALAPDKPILVTQTAASSTREGGGSDPQAKDRFLEESYRLLARERQVLGVMYFNIDKECDWAVFRDGEVAPGYRAAVASPGMEYLPPSALAEALSVRR